EPRAGRGVRGPAPRRPRDRRASPWRAAREAHRDPAHRRGGGALRRELRRRARRGARDRTRAPPRVRARVRRRRRHRGAGNARAREIVVLLERTELLAEGAGAAALAAVLEPSGRIGGKKVGVVISGGNIDPNLLGKALQQGLVSAGRYLAFRTWLEDKPGMLHDITGVLAREHINILHVGIHRLGPYAALGRVGLDAIVDTRDRAHARGGRETLPASGCGGEEALPTARAP